MPRLTPWWLSCALLVACGGGNDPEMTDPCANSICGTSGSGAGSNAGASGSASGGAGNAGGSSAGGAGGVKPSLGPPADLDMEFYKCNVEPVMDRACAMMGCHGTESGRPYRIYARGRLRNDQMVPQVGSCLPPGQPMNLKEEGTGTVMCLGWSPHTDEEWSKNFESAAAFMGQNITPEQSELLTQPTQGSGFAHAGVHPFTQGDANYTQIQRWLSGEKLGSACDTGPN